MGEVCVRQGNAGPKVAAPRRRDGAPPAGRGSEPAGSGETAPKACQDSLELSAACRTALDLAQAGPRGDRHDLPDAPSARSAPAAPVPKLTALTFRKDKLPPISDEQRSALLEGGELLINPQPGASAPGGVAVRVVGYALDEEAWVRMGRPEGFKPVSYLRTRVDLGPVGADLRIKSRTERGEQKVSLDVGDVTWNGQALEKLAKDWALDFAKRNPGVAIPAAVVIVAGGVAGVYFYSKEKGPIEFSVGSVRIFEHDGLEGSLEAKAQVDAEPLSAKLDGVKAKLKYDVPGGHGRVEAGARYDLTEDRWRLESHYGIPLGKNGQGYLGAGAWAEEAPVRAGRDWDYGAGLYASFRF